MTRCVIAHELPEQLAGTRLDGSAAVIIDVLRASTTITHALAAGASRVVPVLEIAEAHRVRTTLAPAPTILGGERHGVRIEGFDLGNSPSEYTPDRVRGRVVVFTTTNGTRAALACREAARVVVGCFANLSAVERAVANASRVYLVCAGTGGARTDEDELFAGALAARLLARGYTPGNAEAGRMAKRWLTIAPDPAAVLMAIRQSCGGRNLAALGMDADVEECARVDTLGLVPVLRDGAFVVDSP